MSMKNPRKNVQQFRPLMDWWLAGSVLLLIALLTAAIFFTAALHESRVFTVIAIVVLVICILYLADIGFFSYYQLEEDGLSIISQMRHAYFPYRDMIEIKPSNFFGLISFGSRKRFALSNRCFLIKLRRGHWRSITVSPAERDAFLNTLLTHIETERSSRATVERQKK